MLTGKKIILFGAGLLGQKALHYFGTRNVFCFVDNFKSGSFYCGKNVISFKELVGIHKNYDVVTSLSFILLAEIHAQLINEGIPFANYNDVISPDDFSSDPRIAKWKDTYKRQRCFLIGNGPSLKAEDLDKLHKSGDISFGCNSIDKIFPYTEWRPNFYCSTHYFTRQLIDRTLRIFKMTKFTMEYNYIFSQQEIDQFASIENLYVLNSIHSSKGKHDVKFCDDISRNISICGTVMFCMLEIAAYMGFGEIILLGADNTAYVLSEDPKFAHFYDSSEDFEHYSDYGTSEMRAAKHDKDTIQELWDYGYTIAKKYADEHDFKILNATRGGRLEAFERVEFDSLF